MLVAFFLRDLLILVFGSVVVAVLLAAISDLIQRLTKIKRGFALTIAIVAIVALVSGAGALFRVQAWGQAQELTDQVPAAWNQTRSTLGQWGIDLPNLNLSNGELADPRAPQRQ